MKKLGPYNQNRCKITDHFKVNTAMLPGVQTYWSERMVKHSRSAGLTEAEMSGIN